MHPDDHLLRLPESFPTGASRFRDSYPGRREQQARIYVKFCPEGVDAAFLALFDTGGHFCLLNETVAGLVRDRLTEGLGPFTVRTPYGTVSGDLYLHRIKIIAEIGESLDIEATVFIPPDWDGPCFLGYTGASDRFQFAVSPGENLFRFGTL